MSYELFFSNDQTPDARNFNAQILGYVQNFYNQPTRFYHNFDHITEMILTGKKTFHLTFKQYLAILFHDLVYNAKSSINESQSARQMFTIIAALRGPMSQEDLRFFGDVAVIINDTKDHYYPTTEESKVVLDLDLERLARPLPEVEHFSDLIRQEFSHVSDEDFEKGRKDFYQKFLLIEHPFSTEYGRQFWEPKAKENIRLMLDKM